MAAAAVMQSYDVEFEGLDDVLDQFLLPSNATPSAARTSGENIKGVVPAASSHATETVESQLERLEKECCEVADELRAKESDILEQFTASMPEFRELDREIEQCDQTLASIGEVLSNFHSDLQTISDEIKSLQTESMQMSTNLRNRRAASHLLTNYVNGLIISQELARTICEGEIDDHYVQQVEELCRKLDGVSRGSRDGGSSSSRAQFPPRTTPGSGALGEEQQHGALPELERLKLKAIYRVHTFLLQKIQTLKKPKTNLQILQQNVLLSFKYFNAFLGQHAPEALTEIRQSYIQTMGKVYLQQFKTYLLSLSKLQLEWGPGRADLLCNFFGTSAAGGAESALLNDATGNMAKMASYLGIGESLFKTKMNEKGNVFSLSGRNAVLENDLDKDPIVAHLKSELKYYPEALFRSHQRLLIDTASSEFHFLTEFFLGENIGARIFQDVFERTLQFFHEKMVEYTESCYDSVGLLIQIRVVEYYKEKMTSGRNLHILDAYFDKILLEMWPRLRLILAENTNSLQEFRNISLLDRGTTTPVAGTAAGNAAANTQGTTSAPSSCTHPHFVTRRYAELFASLTLLQAPVVHQLAVVEGSTSGAPKALSSHQLEQQKATTEPDEVLVSSLATLQAAFVTELQAVASRCLPKVDARVFLINNYDLILTVFYERQLPPQVTGHFEDLLRTEVAEFIEMQFRLYYPDMIDFVQAHEVKAGDQHHSSGDASASEQPANNSKRPAGSAASSLDVKDLNSTPEKISRHFAGSWKQNMSSLHAFIMNAFVNFNNGKEILKQCLTQLLLYYTRYQKCLHKLNALRNVQELIVPNSAILQEIKNYSKGF
ncbi:unnamed protein product [Amoebophrya sp. A120]|nr:unnamed protein product [Amoebophrya sp. A120]|eukprot:GSA120T00002274001.1